MHGIARAMVFTGPGEPLALREFPLPALAAGEVLVKVVCCTICGSDLHTFEGRRSTPCPTILGHEILGRVARLPATGPVRDHLGQPLSLGDRVTWSVGASCGACFFCRRGLPQKCERLFKYGHEQITETHPLSGGFAEFCHLAPGTAILRIPDELPDAVACPVNCATATVAAALRAGGDRRDEVVLVQGAGVLGLTACAMARAFGARHVIATDVDPKRLVLSERFGATHAVSVAQGTEELAGLVQAVSEGRGVDLALELCGAPGAVESALDLIRIGGRYILVGAVFPGRPVSLPAEKVVRRMLRIQGVHDYAPEDLAAAVQFLAGCCAQYPFEDLVPAHFPLTEANAAFRHARETGVLRVAVAPR